MTSTICLRCKSPFKGRGSRCPACTSKLTKVDTLRRAGAIATRIRGTRKWQRFRAKILERDGHRCTYGTWLGDERQPTPDGRCTDRRRSRLGVHHVQGVEDYPELAFVEDNCRTLCTTHHNRIEAKVRSGEERDG